jgi:hypothetical protein
MSADQSELGDVVDAIWQHVFGVDGPAPVILSNGQFPDQWCERYLTLLAVATNRYREDPLWPARLVSAIHFAANYLPLRYDVWRSFTGTRNEETERQLSMLKSPSELFLMYGSLRGE